MRSRTRLLMCVAVVLVCGNCLAQAQDLVQVRDLFNGKDLSGWVNVNTAKDTWAVQDGTLMCTGQPIGILRTDRQYENFILTLEWKHLTAGRQFRRLRLERGCPAGGQATAQGRRGPDPGARMGRPEQSDRRLRPRRDLRHGRPQGHAGQSPQRPQQVRREPLQGQGRVEPVHDRRRRWRRQAVRERQIRQRHQRCLRSRRVTSAWSPKAP